MPSSKAKGQVRVRGTCKNGHVTEAVSDPGRVTWQGVCSADGCEEQVKARRAPRARPEVTADATPPADDVDKPKLRKVSYDAAQPKQRGTRKPEGATPPAPPADLQEPKRGEPDDASTAAERRIDAGTGPTTRRGLRDRIRERKQPSAAFRLPWE